MPIIRHISLTKLQETKLEEMTAVRIKRPVKDVRPVDSQTTLEFLAKNILDEMIKSGHNSIIGFNIVAIEKKY